MASGGQGSIEGPIRKLWSGGVAGSADDQALLSLYTDGESGESENAFRLLVARHGPMVLRVCRRLLPAHHDAEDVAQAVFLVLARKAHSIRVNGTIAPWLFGVARRVAARARSRAANRQEAEIRTATVAANLRSAENEAELSASDWEQVHEEVDRLPEKYRSAVILCYLQGLTYEEAARRIGCPVGTIRIRLSRARDKLRRRLERCGFGPQRVASIGWFAADPTTAITSISTAGTELFLGTSPWADATVKAARALCLGRHALAGTISASVMGFYEGGIQMMSISAWKHAAAWLVMAGMAGAGAIVLAASGPGTQEKPGVLSGREESKPAQPQPVAKPAQNDDTLKQMREQIDRRLAAARQRMESQRAYYEEGRITIDRFIEASHELMLAELSSSQTNEQKLAAAKSHWDRMVQVQSRERAEMTIGKGTIADVAEVSLAVENAAIEYLRMSNPRSLPDVEDLRLRVEALERQLEAIKKRLGSENAIRKVSPKR